MIRRLLLPEITPDPAGTDGAVGYLIEQVKRRASGGQALDSLMGKGTGFTHYYDMITEPYTLVPSDDALASHVWHVGDRNFCDRAGWA